MSPRTAAAAAAAAAAGKELDQAAAANRHHEQGIPSIAVKHLNNFMRTVHFENLETVAHSAALLLTAPDPCPWLASRA